MAMRTSSADSSTVVLVAASVLLLQLVFLPGATAFRPAVQIHTDSAYTRAIIDIADTDRDGDLDLVVAFLSGSFGQYLHHWEQTAVRADGGIDVTDDTLINLTGGTTSFVDLRLADLAGDGYEDIVLAVNSNGVLIYHNTPSGFTETAASSGPGTTTFRMEVADFNDRGWDSIVTYSLNADCYIHERTSIGDSFQVRNCTEQPKPCNGALPFFHVYQRVPGDAHKLLFPCLTSSIVLRRTGAVSGSEISFSPYDVAHFDDSVEWSALVVGNVNGDPYMDYLLGTEEGFIYIFTGTATENMQAGGVFQCGTSKINDMMLADFDGDGDMDLVVVNTTSVVVLDNVGGSSIFSETQSVVMNGLTEWRTISSDLYVHDINGDGSLDIILTLNGPGSVWMIPGSGGGLGEGDDDDGDGSGDGFLLLAHPLFLPLSITVAVVMVGAAAGVILVRRSRTSAISAAALTPADTSVDNADVAAAPNRKAQSRSRKRQSASRPTSSTHNKVGDQAVSKNDRGRSGTGGKSRKKSKKKDDRAYVKSFALSENSPGLGDAPRSKYAKSFGLSEG